MTKRDTQKVLARVNKIRKGFGLAALSDLPKGRRNNQEQNPIALALAGIPGYIAITGYRVRTSRHDTAQAIAKMLGSVAYNDRWYTGERYAHKVERTGDVALFTQFTASFNAGNMPQYEAA